MFNALKKLFGGQASGQNGASFNNQGSKSLAKSRLSFVLIQDRTGLTNDEMTQFKREMVAVIEKYFEINEQGFDVSYQRQSDTTTLLINSPVVVRRKLNKARAAALEKMSVEESEISADSETASSSGEMQPSQVPSEAKPAVP